MFLNHIWECGLQKTRKKYVPQNKEDDTINLGFILRKAFGVPSMGDVPLYKLRFWVNCGSGLWGLFVFFLQIETLTIQVKKQTPEEMKRQKKSIDQRVETSVLCSIMGFFGQK